VKPDSMMVEPKMIAQARQKVADAENEEMFAELKQREPVLGSWVEQELLSITGKMGLCGTPHNVLVGTYHDFASVLLTALEAVRCGHYALWKDSLTGAPLEAMLKDETEGDTREVSTIAEDPDLHDPADPLE